LALTYPEFAEALYQALKPDPYFATLERWVAAGSARQAMLAYYDFSMLEALEFGTLFLPEDQAYGVSVWLQPLSAERAKAKKQRREAFIVARFGEQVLERYQQIMALMDANAAPLIEDDAWYLSLVGVLPEFQNQGLGAGLITPVLEAADRAGVSTYLETFTPRNKTFYARLGYQDAGTFAEPVTGASYAVMVRLPAD
jgi:GNAT superfamily N-acetyltransferase